MQEIYKKFGNLVPNEMQNKIAESYDKNLKNLDEFKPIKTQLDDYLKPHNDMEERMSKLDQFADKHLRGMAKFNINCSNPGERKACVEVLRSQQTQMKANLAKVPPGSPI